MSAPRGRAYAAVVLLACALAVPSRALADVGAARADQIARAAVKLDRFGPDAVLYRLGRELQPSDFVSEAGAGGSGTLTHATLGQPAWLFWEDLMPGARFEHPSRLLIVSALTGRVLREQPMSWWPQIDGHDAPFDGANYGSYARPREFYVDRPPGAPPPPTAPAPHPAPPPAPDQLPKDAFKGECIVTIGLTSDPDFRNDFTGMNEIARRYAPFGLRIMAVPAAIDPQTKKPLAPGAPQLRAEVDKSVKGGCEDIMIYMSGHGLPKPGTKNPAGRMFLGSPQASVLVGIEDREMADKNGRAAVKQVLTTVSSQDLAAIFKAHPKTGFKVKIDACYAGRFVDDLPKAKYPNMLVLETATDATTPAWSYLPGVWVKDGKEAQPYTPGAKYHPNTTNNPGNKNPRRGRGEFTNGDLAGFIAFTTSAAKVKAALSRHDSLLALMMVSAFSDGAGEDLARTSGLTRPQLVDNLPADGDYSPLPRTG